MCQSARVLLHLRPGHSGLHSLLSWLSWLLSQPQRRKLMWACMNLSFIVVPLGSSFHLGSPPYPPYVLPTDWAFCRSPSLHPSQSCSDLHGHPTWPCNVGHLARHALLSASSLPYLSSADKVLDVDIVGLWPCELLQLPHIKNCQGCLPPPSVLHSLFLAILPEPTSDTASP